MSTSNQKVIPISDTPSQPNDHHEPAAFNEFEQVETEEEPDNDLNLDRIGEFSFEREWEKIKARLTYDYFKASMRWLLESASIEFTITVRVC